MIKSEVDLIQTQTTAGGYFSDSVSLAYHQRELLVSAHVWNGSQQSWHTTTVAAVPANQWMRVVYSTQPSDK